MTDPDTPRRIELPPGVPLWDGEHDTSVGYKPHHQRGECTCGWHGRWRSGPIRGHHASADADQHFNDES